jgi:hypothetical protein
MNETEEQVIEILTSHPRSNMPWVEPMRVVAKTMKWTTEKTRLYVEYLMHCKYIVLKSDGMHKPDEPGDKGQFWWERG